jgi:hypothetical protein
MNTLSLTIRYRPIRIGWCLRADDMASFRRAVEFSHTMWGGRYNPVIPVDDPTLSDNLVSIFRVDILWPLTDDPDVTAFIARHPHLENPFSHKGLFEHRPPIRRRPLLIDIYHPILRLRDELARLRDPRLSVHINTWEDSDPLADVMRIALGALPPVAVTGVDYRPLLLTSVGATVEHIAPTAPVPVRPQPYWNLSRFSHAFIERHHTIINECRHPGFYVGSAASFHDLVTFWNLRATDASLVFYDPAHASRLDALRADWKAALEARPPGQRASDNMVALWSTSDHATVDTTPFGNSVLHCPVTNAAWNGLSLRAPYMYFSEGPALAAVSDIPTRPPRITFQLPKNPLADSDRPFGQHLVVSVDPGIGLFGNERDTIETPFLPQLNEYYGRNVWFHYAQARAEPDSLGLICDATTHDISLNAMRVTELVGEIFKLASITATPSKPGLIGAQLIEQMGGLQRCRAFKIPGVRQLIEGYAPDQHFTWSAATQAIFDKDPKTGDSSLSRQTGLYIEGKHAGAGLTSDIVFKHLLAKQIFRPGLRLDCPRCQLEFWVPLDSLRTTISCDYCGNNFNVTPFLKDRGDWAFRRSGLFGRRDNQEGAVPVVLTLQQLATSIHHNDGFVYTTAMSLVSSNPSIRPCETDFVALSRNPVDRKIDLAIGECKTRQEITADDVAKLKAVADAVPEHLFNPYIVLSKLAGFSPSEIESSLSIAANARSIFSPHSGATRLRSPKACLFSHALP